MIGNGSGGAVRVELAPASAAAGLDPITVHPDAETPWHLRRIDAEHAALDRGDAGDVSAVLLLPVEAAETPGVVHREVVVDGWRVVIELESDARASLRERARRGRLETGGSGPASVRAIIPGVVVAVSAKVGDSVTAGQQLLVVEAMKMQNELRAPRAGTIEKIAVGPGQTIEVGDLLVVIA
jgi:biotin carboxyl carrier protein